MKKIYLVMFVLITVACEDSDPEFFQKHFFGQTETEETEKKIVPEEYDGIPKSFFSEVPISLFVGNETDIVEQLQDFDFQIAISTLPASSDLNFSFRNENGEFHLYKGNDRIELFADFESKPLQLNNIIWSEQSGLALRKFKGNIYLFANHELVSHIKIQDGSLCQISFNSSDITIDNTQLFSINTY